jgi:hypothetical protein
LLWLLLASCACKCWVNEVHRRWLLWRGHVLTASEVPALWPEQSDAQADAQAANVPVRP